MFMKGSAWTLRANGVAALAVACVLAACSGSDDNTGTGITVTNNNFSVTRLVSDVSGAQTTDADLKNAWGLAFGSTGNLWVADNHTSMSTVYDQSGAKQSLSVAIPTSGNLPAGSPTGLVFNNTTDFDVLATGPATFIFAGEDGIISAWNPSLNSQAIVMSDQSSAGAVYKGLAISSVGGENLLFATDFHNNKVDVFDGSFNLVNSFTDPNLPAGYAPFGIQLIGDHVWVTFAKQDHNGQDDVAGAGLGYVDLFNTDGTINVPFAQNGPLNAPWGIALAPAGFGGLGNKVLIGNFGDGRILAYSPTGTYLGPMKDATGAAITIDGLWGLAFGPTSGSTTLYFTAGPNDETGGLMGTITPQ
jgi:uncharacterized protein (TIGR03118 family)